MAEPGYGGFEESLPVSGWGMGGRVAFALPDGTGPARAAARSVPLRDLLDLARWLAPCRPLTSAGMLGADDVRAVVAELGLWPAVTEAAAADRADRLRRLNDARDLPEFAALWRAAVELGVVEVESQVARPAAGFADGDPDGLLAVWEALFRSAVRGDEIPGREVGGNEVLPAALRVLLGMPEGAAVPLMELVDLAWRMRRDRYPAELEPRARATVTEAVYAGVVRLARAGAVRLVGVSPAGLLVPHRLGRGRSPLPLWPGAQETTSTEPVDCAVVLTALGRHGTRLLAPGDGPRAEPVAADAVPAPRSAAGSAGASADTGAAGRAADTGTTGFLDRLSTLPPRWHDAEIGPWLAGRTAAEAVRDIAAATAKPGPLGALRRTIGVSVLAAVGDGAAPELRALLGSGSPEVTGLAAGALMALPGTSPGEHRDLLAEYGPWWTIDTVSGLLALGEEHLGELFGPGVGEGPDALGELLLSGQERVWRVDHPEALPVLEALGRLHPDARVAAAARRAADRARTRRG
ncbi:hypothetical protein [Nocardiopsis sp. CC223A]|uniref:hypothetical protein n=1 Tax=Nocardiopsis sp. CC223A TaxID=3044051 RepID=UPI00278C373B|nr:hypothetical protein [Nocardiopsis sp. CC223A]